MVYIESGTKSLTRFNQQALLRNITSDISAQDCLDVLRLGNYLAGNRSNLAKARFIKIAILRKIDGQKNYNA
jgi:hypothetical protein